MKHIKQTMKALVTLSLLAGLSACQQHSLDPAVAKFQAEAGQVLQTQAKRVNAAFRVTAQGQSRGARGLAGAGVPGIRGLSLAWDDWGFNNHAPLLHYDIEQALASCEAMVNNIPVAPQNFYFMVATLGRCLEVAVSYRNPIYAMAFRNLDPNSQYYRAYLYNYGRPGTLDSFQQNDYHTLSTWANHGGIRF